MLIRGVVVEPIVRCHDTQHFNTEHYLYLYAYCRVIHIIDDWNAHHM
jgi:hypothetical protein